MGSKNRRAFLRGVPGVAAQAAPPLSPKVDTSGSATARRAAALTIRQNAAVAQNDGPAPRHTANGDETALPHFLASYTKGLPHSQLGEVDPNAYHALLSALASGRTADFEQLPRGLGGKFSNPIAGHTYTLMGCDAQMFATATAPAFGSAAMAADMVELYWQAQLRDVHFLDYPSSALVQRAASELTQLSAYRGPRDSSGRVTASNLFRGLTPGDLSGPYLSQFLLRPCPVNSGLQDQSIRVGTAGADYVRTYDLWAPYQSGMPPSETESFDPQPRYIRNGRDLAQWSHYDYPQLAFQNAAFITFDMRPESVLNKNVYQLAPSNPYKTSVIQTGFVTFSIVHLLSLIGYASTEALHAAWFQKWMVHRRLRPDTMGGRVHNRLTGAASYPLPGELLNSDAVKYTFQKQGTYLLSQAYVEASPFSPAYPSGHAAVAGAGATLMKAFFDETALVPNAVIPAADGLSLVPYNETALTIGNEANKLAYNVAMGRNWAGVNYRSDIEAGLLLGEEVAIRILQDAANAPAESFPGFYFTRFDGTPVAIKPSSTA